MEDGTAIEPTIRLVLGRTLQSALGQTAAFSVLTTTAALCPVILVSLLSFLILTQGDERTPSGQGSRRLGRLCGRGHLASGDGLAQRRTTRYSEGGGEDVLEGGGTACGT